MKFKLNFGFILLSLLLNTNSTYSQNIPSNGIIQGLIISETDNMPVLFANVWLKDQKTGTTTDEKGFFILKGLSDGNYNLTISCVNYKTTEKSNLVITNSQLLNIGTIRLKENSITLSEIVVSPGSYSIIENIKTSSGLTLSEQNIKNMAWAEDITRSVSRLPGISASDYSSKFAIRGGEANQVLMSLDGMELYEPFHQRDYSGGLFSIVDIEAIRGVDLLTGGFSAEIGNRLSGAFAMKTKNVQPNQQHFSAGVSIMNARVYADGKFAKNKGTYLFSARRGMLDLSLKAIGNKEFFPKFYDGLSKIEYALNEKHILSFHLLHSGDKAFIDNAPGDDKEYDEYATKYNSTYGWVTLKSFYTKKLNSRTILYSGNINHNRTGGFNKYDNSDKGSFSVNDQRDYTLYGIKQDWTWEAYDKLHFKLGFEAKEINAKYNYTSAIHELRLDSNERVYNFNRDLNIALKPKGEQVGTYITGRFNILPKLIAELGGRFDYTSYTGDKNWSPRISMVYAFSRNTFLRAGWGHYYQSQFINNIDVNNGNTAFNPYELAKHYVLGFEHKFKNNLNIRMETYYKDLSNLSPLWQNLRDHLENYPEARNDNARVTFNGSTSKGVELFLRYDEGKKISYWFSYALANATDNIKDIEFNGLLEKKVGKVPRLNNQNHTIYADINYRPTKTWHLSVSWQYYQGWPRTTYTYRYTYLPNGDKHFYQVHSSFNGIAYPAYHRLDIRINKSFKIKSSNITGFLHLVNVYNRKNLKKFDLDTRNDQGQLSLDNNGNYVPFEDNKYWLKFLPVFGIKWEIGKE